jgi:4-azaleucine resistance transporter AzlC
VRLGAIRAGAFLAGELVWGLAFGALARTSGLTLWETAAMSGLVFAGTAQLAATALWATQVAALPVLGIVLTTFVVNLRNVMLGLALAPWLGRASARRAYAAIFFLTDESWALTAAERARRGMTLADSGGPGVGFLVGSGAVFWVAWVGASAAGHVAGGAMREPERWALDFATVAAIIVLLAALWRGREDVTPWVAAAAASIGAAVLLPGSWYILIGALVGTAAGALRTARPANAGAPGASHIAPPMEAPSHAR